MIVIIALTLDGYEVDAIDYLVKPLKQERFEKAVEKAFSYHQMLLSENGKQNPAG